MGPGKRGSSRRGPDAGAVYSFFPSSVPFPSAGGRGARGPGGGGGLAHSGPSLREVAPAQTTPGGGAELPHTLPSSGSRLGLGSVRASHAPLDSARGARTSTRLGRGPRAGGGASGKVGQGCALAPARDSLRFTVVPSSLPFHKCSMAHKHINKNKQAMSSCIFLKNPFFEGSETAVLPRELLIPLPQITVFESSAPSHLVEILQTGLDARVFEFKRILLELGPLDFVSISKIVTTSLQLILFRQVINIIKSVTRDSGFLEEKERGIGLASS